MATRSTMTDLVADLRQRSYAGTADYSVAGVDYWSAQQLQDILDRHRVEWFAEPIAGQATYAAGTVKYYDYPLPDTNWEKTDGGTATFYIQDGTNTTVVGTAYTADYNRGYLTFGTDTAGTVYQLYGRSYDVDAAAAEVWRQKAAYYASRPTFATDNHSVRAGDLYKQALDMAAYYEQRSGEGVRVTTLTRSDVDATA